MLEEITAIGLEYIDSYPNKIRMGGIHNFIGPKISLGLGICEFDKSGQKIYENTMVDWNAINNLEVGSYHLMYADRLPVESFKNHKHSFLSVDFADYYENVDRNLINFWDKWADLMFFSIKDLGAILPLWANEAIFHCADGVVYQIGDSKSFVRNTYKIDGLTDLVGAGDTFCSFILNNMPISTTTIDLANKKTANFLRARHEKI